MGWASSQLISDSVKLVPRTASPYLELEYVGNFQEARAGPPREPPHRDQARRCAAVYLEERGSQAGARALDLA